MNRLLRLLLVLCASLAGATALSARTSTALVTFAVGTINAVNASNAISVSGNPATLIVNSAVAGAPPAPATDSTTTYNLTSKAANQRITASISTAMPTGVKLIVALDAPKGGTSSGEVSLTTTAQNLVTGISNIAQSNLGIIYTLRASVNAAVQGPTTTIVTYTLGP